MVNLEDSKGDDMDEATGAAQKESPRVAADNSRVILHYVVIAVACFVIGLILGRAAPRPAAEQEPVSFDEEQLRAVVASVLEERALANEAEEGPDRFALVDDDPYLGDTDAPVVIIEFSDFFCSFCKRHFDQTFAPLLENYGKYIRYVYRDFARLTQESTPAAAAAQCAFEQGKFWEFHGEFFESQDSLGGDFYIETAEKYELDIAQYTECLDEERYIDEVDIDGLDGQLAGVRGTPGFFINGQILSGAQPYSIFERMVQRELDKAGINYRGNDDQ